MSNVGKSGNSHQVNAISSHPTYQSSSVYSIPTNSAQNTSVDSSFKQQDKSVPSFLANQKQPVASMPSKVVNNSYGYQSMGTLNPQNRPNIPNIPMSTNINSPPQQILQNPAIFKKH
jgi:hypothetical protein